MFMLYSGQLLGATQSMHAENLTSVRHYANAPATSEDQGTL